MAERGTKYASLARYLFKVIRKLVNTEFILNIYQNIMQPLYKIELENDNFFLSNLPFYNAMINMSKILNTLFTCSCWSRIMVISI